MSQQILSFVLQGLLDSLRLKCGKKWLPVIIMELPFKLETSFYANRLHIKLALISDNQVNTFNTKKWEKEIIFIQQNGKRSYSECRYC